ncbi:LysR family transcriptional regulator [Pusillimonas sp. NJUB218]|uniref:LysR family transcriptional regulator n=1 Tax=Pusillimonas sp. NJUB218 TaxID=2023230 RepID=UPI000F4AFCD2|nr:LysR family transcriptional regulator [Pusillimonas sp. NJUB218]ROT45568.1 LysR family transcriptional regulator [Pusillimonas sp. NJUB218]
MDRLDAMHLFSRIVDLGSFSKAAEELRLPRASVSLAIQQLEGRLGVRLLQRTTRHVSPTEDGLAYYLRCQQILADVDDAETQFRSNAATPRGKIRVDLQGTQALRFVLPRLGEFHERYPDIELDIGLGDRYVDLLREGLDCALRSGEPKDSSMVCRRVALLEQVTCAGKDYLAHNGMPQTLDEFKTHDAVNYIGANGRKLPFEFLIDDVKRSMQLDGPVTVSSAYAYVACCRAGLGFIQVPRYHVETFLKSGELVEIFPEWAPAPMPVSVMYPHARYLSSRVRVFIEWVAECMSIAK